MKKNILIIRFSALGDLITYEPYFRAFRTVYRDYKITFLTKNIGFEIYKNFNYFDDILLHKTTKTTIKKLKNIKFDVVFNLQCNRTSHIITLFARKNILVNISNNIIQRFFGIKNVHVKNIIELLQSANVEEQKINSYLKNKDYKKISLQREAQVTKDDKLIVISTGSSNRWVSKRWGVENYIELIKRLIKEGFKITLVGSNVEKEDSQKITNSIKNGVENLVGKTTISELIDILSKARLYLGNDSGPSHLSAAVKTDTLTIFTSTSKKHCVKFMPYFGNHEYLVPETSVVCAPCYKTYCPKKNDEYMQCSKSISIDKVFNLAMNILKRVDE